MFFTKIMTTWGLITAQNQWSLELYYIYRQRHKFVCIFIKKCWDNHVHTDMHVCDYFFNICDSRVSGNGLPIFHDISKSK